jgi:hypothetical protein
MKPAGLLQLVPAGLALIACATEPAADGPPKLSTRLSQEIRSSLPKYVIPATQPVGSDTAPPDPDVLVLPKMVVREKRLPGNDPDVWLGERVVQQKAMSAYRDSMTDFEWALNWWFVPIFSSPASVRARATYENGKVSAELSRLSSVIDTIGRSDPKEAAKLRQALDSAKLLIDH